MRCCRVPAGLPVSLTSGKFVAIAPTSSARRRRSARTKAVEWRLVDEMVPNSKWKETVAARAKKVASRSDRPKDARGITFTPLERRIEKDRVSYSHVDAEIDRARGACTLTVRGPSSGVPASVTAAHTLGAQFWPLAVARELEDAILHLRTNEAAIGVMLFRTAAVRRRCLSTMIFLRNQRRLADAGDTTFLKRVLKRVDVTAKSLIALIEPGSCFAGTLAELAFAADRSLMLTGSREGTIVSPLRSRWGRRISASIRWATG